MPNFVLQLNSSTQIIKTFRQDYFQFKQLKKSFNNLIIIVSCPPKQLNYLKEYKGFDKAFGLVIFDLQCFFSSLGR